MREGRILGESGRLARVVPVVDRAFDIPAMTRLAVGPSWASLTPAQQQQLIAAFGHYVAATYADQFDTYSGEQLQITGERPHGADVVVETRIAKSKGDVMRLDYLMREGQGSPRIGDVYLDGSISQLAVNRSEFHSILDREGVDGLVMALNRKLDLLRNVPAVRGKRRCRMHGGAVGSGAPTGNTNALKHGRYTAEAIARRRQLSELIRMARVTLAELKERR
jgi:phospholipid transport system substrate-binding protein